MKHKYKKLKILSVLLLLAFPFYASCYAEKGLVEEENNLTQSYETHIVGKAAKVSFRLNSVYNTMIFMRAIKYYSKMNIYSYLSMLGLVVLGWCGTCLLTRILLNLDLRNPSKPDIWEPLSNFTAVEIRNFMMLISFIGSLGGSMYALMFTIVQARYGFPAEVYGVLSYLAVFAISGLCQYLLPKYAVRELECRRAEKTGIIKNTWKK